MESRKQQEAVSHVMEPWDELTGKVVLITGASSGSGLEFAVDLAKAGCKIIAVARREDKLKSLCEEINKEYGGGNVRAVAIALDVSADSPTIEAAVKKAWDAFGRIDALINNAGISGRPMNPLDMPEEEWNHIFRTNLTGSWLLSKYVGIHMREAKIPGSIINISSIAGTTRVYLPGGVAYASSKAAVNTLTKIMAMELGPINIRVNCINPGIFKSEITEGLINKAWFNNVTVRTVPLQTLGTVDPALTSLVRYLIHDSSSYVSGSCFIADAGTSLATVPIFSSL